MDYTLRVIVSQDDYRKVVLSKSEAEDVDTLIAALSKKLDLKYQFRLQYQDKDFDNEFVNLTDAKDIQDKSTVKIIQLSVLDSDDPDSIDESLLDGSFLTNASKDLDSTAGSSVTSDADTISVTSSEHGEKFRGLRNL